MKIGFTGTRHGMNMAQKEALVLYLSSVKFIEFHHGDCIGADEEAHDIVREFFPDVKIVIHPPVKNDLRALKEADEIKGEFNYLERDRNIVESTELLIGAPSSNTEERRSGTWYTIRHARKLRKDYLILER